MCIFCRQIRRDDLNKTTRWITRYRGYTRYSLAVSSAAFFAFPGLCLIEFRCPLTLFLSA